jgi:hypothetical protein
VRHARPADLAPLAALLEELRRIDGLQERSPGTFYRRSKGFLHFHADAAGMFADLKVDGEFVRSRVSTVREQRALLAAVRRAAS